MIQLFIGGVRSGKSAAAETTLQQQLQHNSSYQAAYIATSIASDPETKQRIKRHQQQREADFNHSIDLYELDYQKRDLLTCLQHLDKPDNLVLVECLSTWVAWYLTLDNDLATNLQAFKVQQQQLLSFLKQTQCSVILVTGEVGCGLIGETQLQRRYADCLGELNQQIAAIADNVYLVTAGISQQIKG